MHPHSVHNHAGQQGPGYRSQPARSHRWECAQHRPQGRRPETNPDGVPGRGNGLVAVLLDHPSVIHSELSSAEALKVIGLLDESRAWDGIAGQVVLAARQRGWPVLTTDPGRLQRIAPDLAVNLL